MVQFSVRMLFLFSLFCSFADVLLCFCIRSEREKDAPCFINVSSPDINDRNMMDFACYNLNVPLLDFFHSKGYDMSKYVEDMIRFPACEEPEAENRALLEWLEGKQQETLK